jgi:hypothetical protein
VDFKVLQPSNIEFTFKTLLCSLWLLRLWRRMLRRTSRPSSRADLELLLLSKRRSRPSSRVGLELLRLSRRNRHSSRVGLKPLQLWRVMLKRRRRPSSSVEQELLLLWRMMRKRVLRRQQLKRNMFLKLYLYGAKG